MTWLDTRVDIYNLKDYTTLNTLPESERKSIWVPKLTFNNTKNNMETMNDAKAIASVTKFGNYTKSPLTFEDNVYIFKVLRIILWILKVVFCCQGTENPISITRNYDIQWVCNYDVRWYPFDTQRCKMILVSTKAIEDFVVLVLGDHKYTGATLLTEYAITR